jgi:hypothetical protein
MNQPIKSPDAFLQGQRDCQAGIPHESGKGADYVLPDTKAYHAIMYTNGSVVVA